MTSLQIDFRGPEHGWIQARVSMDSVAVEESVSDVPADSLAGLVSALIHVAGGVSESSVIWHLEPEEWEWSFRSDGDKVTFRAACPHLPTVEGRLPKSQLLQSMVTALTRLQTESAWQNDEQAWSWPFPQAPLERLCRLSK